MSNADVQLPLQDVTNSRCSETESKGEWMEFGEAVKGGLLDGLKLLLNNYSNESGTSILFYVALGKQSKLRND